MVRVLHFADAHIDMANYGRHDPESGLPLRVMDFLKSLDTIVDTAINEDVDIVLFAGDAFKDRTPAPTFQREWGRRIMRLSHAGIPTLLLVGNHDLSPALGRAHALDSYETLEVPYVQVLDRPVLLGPSELHGLPLQVLAIPWISRSGMIAHLGLKSNETVAIYDQLSERIIELVEMWLESADPNLATILTAHCSVQGATYGGERTVMLGSDLVLPGSLMRDSRLDYVALGHIHKPQNLNPDAHPPVIYPGSIERVDFGEAKDEKFFVIAQVERGNTQVEWRKLDNIRPYIDRYLRLERKDGVSKRIQEALPEESELTGAIVRLVLEYPREWEPLIDDAAIREYTADAFEFHFVKRPVMETRVRLPEDKTIGSLSPIELLDIYLRASHVKPAELEDLKNLAIQVIRGTTE